MLFPDWILKRNVKEDEKIEVEEEIVEVQSLDELVENLIRQGIEDIEEYDICSDRMTAGIHNVEDLSEILERLRKSEAETKKAEAQVIEAKAKKGIGDQTIARIIAIGASVVVVIFWTGVERNSPVPMRIVRFIEAMTVPKL